jgi:hypothetical protein
MCKPDDGGSVFFNCKNFFSIVLMAVADYCFISTDEGAYGASSDCNIFKNSSVSKILEANNLNVPASRPLPIDDNGTPITFVIVGYEAFALSQHVLRPYPSRNLDVARRIYYYRLTRGEKKWWNVHLPLCIISGECSTLQLTFIQISAM